jgi:undecaprenyl-diphosphatase
MGVGEAIVLGLVQGLTEFLPISSTAHLRIVPALLGWKDPGAAFSAVIQLGTVVAVLAYFSKDLVRLTGAFVSGLVARKPFEHPDARLAWFVGIGSVPIVVCGLLFKKAIKHELRSLYVMATALIVMALILFVAERIARQTKNLGQATFRDAAVVGICQAFALIPGSSRSGTTLTGALAMGFRREDAARFSFLLSIPATAGAGLYELKDFFAVAPAERPATWVLALATFVAFASGMVAIAGLLRFLRTRSTLVFVVYRVALGLALFGLLSAGVLAP